MLKRTITGAIFVATLVGAIIWDISSLVGLFLSINTVGLLEFYKLAGKTDHKPQAFAGILIGNLIILSVACHFIPVFEQYSIKLFALAFSILFFTFILELYKKHDRPFGNLAYTLLGVVYISVPFSLIPIVGYTQCDSQELCYTSERILGIFFCLWAYDSGAYLSGKFFGKNKLFERISPKKTWEGCIGGGILSLSAAVLISKQFTTFSLTDWQVIAAIVIVAGTFGDLIESMLKRSVDVKDSGTILPGHGGILDRFDSFILAMPFIVTYILIKGV